MQAATAWSAPSMLDEFPTTPPARGGRGYKGSLSRLRESNRVKWVVERAKVDWS